MIEDEIFSLPIKPTLWIIIPLSYASQHCRDRPIYRFADLFGRYQYRYIGIGKLDIGIGLSVSVSVIG